MVAMPPTCANPLLLEWIKEIYDVARERNTKGVTTYKRAYESMKACPLTFTHPSEAQQLDGIGPKICDRLTEKLKEHCEANGLPAPKKPRGKARKRLSGEDLGDVEEPPPAKKPRKAKPYVPSLRSGPYAIILALSSLPEDSLQSLTKAQLIELAQPDSESSFTTPSEAGKFYTAWNSMKQLLDKDLVQERGRPLRKYALTDEGWEVARRIKAVQTDEVDSTVKSKKPQSEEHAPVENDLRLPFDANGFLDLEGDSGDEAGSVLQSQVVHQSIHAGGLCPSSSGQRLGGAPIDKYGTMSKFKEPKPKPGPPPKSQEPKPPHNQNYINLSSSPEPDTAPDIPWAPGSFAQDSRQLTSKPLANSEVRLSQRRPNESTISKKPPLPDTVQKKVSESVNTNLPRFDRIHIPAGTFTVHLILDNREVRTKDDRDYIGDELKKKGVTPLIRPLELGDFFWVAKLHSPTFLPQHGEEGDEIALDWIVERKRLDDLVGSITDGRFQEQKFRLRQSGLKNVVYLIEEFTLSSEKSTKFHEAIQSAIASTQVVNGYFVKQTRKLDETIRYLARLTRMLKSHYESHPLHLIPTSALSPTTYLPLLSHLRTHPSHKEINYHITYPSLASLSSKSDTLTLRDVFLKMLMCTRGISGHKALAIQKQWRTPRAFVEAFEACGTGRAREALVEKKLGGIVGRGRVKGVLGAKVAGVWGER